MTQDRYLHEHRAWNWQWPDERNRWDHISRKRNPSQRYYGPSKRTLAKRAAKGKRG